MVEKCASTAHAARTGAVRCMAKPSTPLKLTRRAPAVPRDDDATLAKLPKLGAIRCALAGAAQTLGVSGSRMTAVFARYGRTRTVFGQIRASAQRRLRSVQFNLAQTSPTMAVFIGKHY